MSNISPSKLLTMQFHTRAITFYIIHHGLPCHSHDRVWPASCDDDSLMLSTATDGILNDLADLRTPSLDCEGRWSWDLHELWLLLYVDIIRPNFCNRRGYFWQVNFLVLTEIMAAARATIASCADFGAMKSSWCAARWVYMQTYYARRDKFL